LVKQALDQSKVILCHVGKIPHLAPGVDFLIIDDAHAITESQTYLGLALCPKRLVLSGTHLMVENHKGPQKPFSHGTSMFKRLVLQHGFVLDLKSQHRAGGLLKKLNEIMFSVPMGREGCF
jgi:hypothetical protein